jgi:hypothetical protein
LFDQNYLINFKKRFTLFKSVIHFSKIADTFDSLLNDAVDLHIQVVDYHQNLADIEFRQRPVTVAGNPTTGIWPPFAGIRSAQIPTTKLVVFRPSSTDWFPSYWPGSGRSVPDSNRSSGLSARTVSFQPFCFEFWPFRNPATFPEFRHLSRILAIVAWILLVSDGISLPVILY